MLLFRVCQNRNKGSLVASLAVDEYQRLVGPEAAQGSQVNMISAIGSALLVVVEGRGSVVQHGCYICAGRIHRIGSHIDYIHRNGRLGFDPIGATTADHHDLLESDAISLHAHINCFAVGSYFLLLVACVGEDKEIAYRHLQGIATVGIGGRSGVFTFHPDGNTRQSQSVGSVCNFPADGYQRLLGVHFIHAQKRCEQENVKNFVHLKRRLVVRCFRNDIQRW